MGVVEMSTRFLRLNPPCAMHQNACNDLETVGDPVLNFLQQDGLVAGQVVFQSRLCARIGHVRHGHEKANMFDVTIIKRLCIDDQLPCAAVRPL